MADKTVEVVVETFGNRNLRKVFTVEDLKGKSVDQIVHTILDQPYQGTDSIVKHDINMRLASSGGYTPQIGFATTDQPVRFKPVARSSPIIDYVRDDQQQGKIRVNIIGDHTVGTYSK